MNEEKKEPNKMKEPTPRTKNKVSENIIYIGPNRLKDGLKKFTIYRTRPNDLITKFKEKYQNIDWLFVSASDLTKAMDDVTKKGTPRNLAYVDLERGE